MKKIIIDTNVWMAISEFKLDLFTELNNYCDFKYKLFVLEATIAELEKIRREQRGKFKRAAALALSLIKAKKMDIIPGEGNVDDLLTAFSKQGCLVLTQDFGLKNRLAKPYLTIRQKKRIIIIN